MPPEPRESGTLTRVLMRFVFLYGGALSETEVDGHLYCLDMNAHKWTIVELAGAQAAADPVGTSARTEISMALAYCIDQFGCWRDAGEVRDYVWNWTETGSRNGPILGPEMVF